jgi:DNA helicase-2/ATP-dependent DNA helicase PcrA
MFDTLTPTQEKIVFEKQGKFVVRACPGSGKTYSVAARLAHKMADWEFAYQGIATISFTNAAWQEIERQITEHFKIQKPIPYPHFLGTIDSFINKFIFLPFGHLVLNCKCRPVLVGEPHGPWTGRFFAERFFDNVSYDADGRLYALDRSRMPKNWSNNRYIGIAKSNLLRAGYANQDDANYFAMRILETYPNVAKALVHRFPMVMVDEAQDTSEIQMRIIDLLIQNGLEEVALVGDPDQAIFEWHDAKPELFVKKSQEWADNSIILNENRRSSQTLCNCTCRLSSLKDTSSAINNDVKNCNISPAIVVYDAKEISHTVDEFIRLCGKANIEVTPRDVAVVYRSRSFFNTITGIKEITTREIPWEDDDSYTKDLARGKYLYDNGDCKNGFKLIEKAIYKILHNARYCSETALAEFIEKNSFVGFRKFVFELITMLPATHCSVGEWIGKSKEAFTQLGVDLHLTMKKMKSDITFDRLFGMDNKQIVEKGFRLGTIHSIKGETFEALLAILKTKGKGGLYKTLLEANVKIEDDEELRIVYVAITRPRRLLVLAVPNMENKTAWEKKLLS